MIEPREFWIHCDENYNLEDGWFKRVELANRNMWDNGQVIHVIEKSAYDEAAANLESTVKFYTAIMNRYLENYKNDQHYLNFLVKKIHKLERGENIESYEDFKQKVDGALALKFIDEAKEELKKVNPLKEENKILIEALKFYADKSNHKPVDGYLENGSNMNDDFGSKAIEALEKVQLKRWGKSEKN
jgi:hypothetical protein